MLDMTLSTDFVPGTNVKGEVAGANWTFLLPSLEVEHVVCLGMPPAATLATLSRVGNTVTIITTTPYFAEGYRCDSLGATHLISIDAYEALPFPAGVANLVVIVDRDTALRLGRSRQFLSEVKRILAPDGVLYFEFRNIVGTLRGGEELDALIENDDEAHRLWLTPFFGEMKTAVPLMDTETRDYVVDHHLFGFVMNKRPLRRAERYLNTRRTFQQLTLRQGVLMGPAAADVVRRPPRYLCRMAEQAGVDIQPYRWALIARGSYSSRKVLFYLFNPHDVSSNGSEASSLTPEYIVKLTRKPALNYRLENEWQALQQLQHWGIGDADTLPRVAFHGHHGGLAIVAETVIDGTPFQQRASDRTDHTYARAAIEWLTALGTATADTPATPKQAADSLERLFRDFVEIYRPARRYCTFLEDQIAIVAASDEPFPLVFQHGDPGIWNAMITKDGRVAFLDWEAAEPHGMPLWDLFYFARSYATSIAGTRGRRGRLADFRDQFLNASAFSSIVVDAVQRYCEKLHLAPNLVEPLFYTCWMHRALKEATRREEGTLGQAHYLQVLQLCIDARNAPTLRAMFPDRTACSAPVVQMKKASR